MSNIGKSQSKIYLLDKEKTIMELNQLIANRKIDLDVLNNKYNEIQQKHIKILSEFEQKIFILKSNIVVLNNKLIESDKIKDIKQKELNEILEIGRASCRERV